MSLCDFEGRLTVYVGYGNVVSVIPLANARTGEKIDMTAASHVQVCVGTTMASSLDDPSHIWWDQNADDDWVIHFRPGMFANVPTGEQSAAIIVFSGTYPNGLVLAHDFPLVIEGIC